MSSKGKLQALAVAMDAEPESKEATKTERQKAVKTVPRRRVDKAEGAPRPRAARATGALKQMTIKLEPAVRSRLLEESLKRKSADLPDWSIQQIVTEAVNQYLGGR